MSLYCSWPTNKTTSVLLHCCYIVNITQLGCNKTGWDESCTDTQSVRDSDRSDSLITFISLLSHWLWWPWEFPHHHWSILFACYCVGNIWMFSLSHMILSVIRIFNLNSVAGFPRKILYLLLSFIYVLYFIITHTHPCITLLQWCFNWSRGHQIHPLIHTFWWRNPEANSVLLWNVNPLVCANIMFLLWHILRCGEGFTEWHKSFLVSLIKDLVWAWTFNKSSILVNIMLWDIIKTSTIPSLFY